MEDKPHIIPHRGRIGYMGGSSEAIRSGSVIASVNMKGQELVMIVQSKREMHYNSIF
ncbi:hypothetical protein DM860_013500 [Cuscuta australis]|uniref:Uncharacterized protein n=1 Tax=Cuscuta australis TaxID=267555 RepID=A0A328EA12_9ASTE|nr:hypothetical protein DM860_013500 [Cuscuta australis]